MPRAFPALFAIAASLAAHAAALDDSGIVLPREPALAPDGSRIVFTWEGDLWSASSAGGRAQRLTVHPAYDHVACFSPAGALAFCSDRYGNEDIWLLGDDDRSPVRLTECSNSDVLVQSSADGASWYFLATLDMSHKGRRLWRMPAEGGAPMQVMDVTVASAAVSPDGLRVVYTRRGADLTRKGYRGSANADLWLYDGRAGTHTRLTDHEGQDTAPVWDPKGDAVYYASDADGTFNLWHLDLGTGEKRQVTSFKDDGIRSPTVSADGSVLAFERGAALYTMRPGEDPARLAFTVPGDLRANRTERLTLTDQASSFALSPDEKQAALTVRGDLGCMKTSGGPAVNLTDDAATQVWPVWPKGSDSIYFITDDRARRDIFCVKATQGQPSLARALKWEVTRVTDTPEPEIALYPSPDGKLLAYVRGAGDLVIRDLASGDERVLLTGWSEPSIAWSPDARWIAYSRVDDEYNPDVWIVPADGSEPPHNISKDPADDGGPAWSPDGKMLAFHSLRGDDWDVYTVYLTREAELEADREARGDTDDLADYAGEQGPAAQPTEPAEAPAEQKAQEPAGPKVEIEFDDIHLRLRRITSSKADEVRPLFSPDSKSIAFSSSLDGKRDMMLMSLRGEDKRTLVPGGGDSYVWDSAGKGIYYLSGGRLRYVSTGGSISDKGHSIGIDRDLGAERLQVFEQAWDEMSRGYYDVNMHGCDWAAMREKYRPVATAVRDPAAFEFVMNMILGELNSSHQGFNTPGPPMPSEPTAWLGLSYDYSSPGPGLLVSRVMPEGPCDQADADVRVGDLLLQVEGRPVDDIASQWGPLSNRVGLRTRLLLRRGGEEGPTTVETVVRPASWGQIRDLWYKDMIHRRRRQVAEMSDGRLAYVHVPGMSMATVRTFERDLYAEAFGKVGLIIDIRDNGGGSTADWMLQMLSVRPHAQTFERTSGRGYPASRRPFYVWQKPIVVLINENSFSNAEIFAHGVQTLGLGKLVGMPTAGGVLSTGGTSFVDGSSMRMPGRGWLVGNTDVEMEGHGAIPEIAVDISPEDEAADRDPQLEAAVRELLAEVTARER